MANIHKLTEQLNILKKYIKDGSEYDVSSYEDENTIVVKVDGVSKEDEEALENLGAGYDDGLWFVG